MHALLLIAHGSRRESANDEVRELAKRVERVEKKRYPCVITAFLELASPDIQTGVDLCKRAGATEITVVPYFLAAGRHVVEDIPKALGEAVYRHKSLKIHLAGHIGQHEDIPILISKASQGEMREMGS